MEFRKGNPWLQQVAWRLDIDWEWKNFRFGIRYEPNRSSGSYWCVYRKRLVCTDRRRVCLYFWGLTIDFVHLKEDYDESDGDPPGVTNESRD